MRFQISIALCFAAGCSGRPGAIRPPSVDASSAASQAIELYDRDGDGALSKNEWSSSAPLVAVAASYDKNGDSKISADEIREGIGSWKQAGVGARIVPFSVRWNGRPLAGATVRLVPAPFLSGALKPASGETGIGGAGQLSLAAEDMPKNAPKIPLMQPGLYSVEITHPSAKLPEKYNAKTTLGIEITSGNPGPEGALWTLTAN